MYRELDGVWPFEFGSYKRSRARRVSRKAGVSHVDDQPVKDLPNSTFGGEKNSGIGRFGGEWAIEAFTTDHRVTLQHTLPRYPFHEQDVKGPLAGG